MDDEDTDINKNHWIAYCLFLFDHIDVDHNGTIDCQEFKEALEHAGFKHKESIGKISDSTRTLMEMALFPRRNGKKACLIMSSSHRSRSAKSLSKKVAS